MKFSKRGTDFLAGLITAVTVSSILDIKIVLALCLTLILAAIISEIILVRASPEGAEITVSEPRVACFKNQQAIVTIKLRSSVQRYTTIKISELIPSRRVEAEVVSSDPLQMSVKIVPRFAGRSLGLPVRFELGDPLGFFKKEASFRLPSFVIDCLPSSILREVTPLRTFLTVVGEREGRAQGLGVEFYSVDEYKGTSEAKDIFWKKVASLADERLLVKLHAQSVHKRISICLLRMTFRDQDRIEWMDSACEGIALMGKTVIQTGSDVELLFDSGGQVASLLATNLKELAEGIMDLSVSQISNLETAAILIDKSDICVTGFKELQNVRVANVVANKPSLLISDPRTSPARIGDNAVIYDENQDFKELVGNVVRK